jgi:hypothetical protein
LARVDAPPLRDLRVTPGDIAALLVAVAALLTLVGGYVQYVLRRTGLGQVEFDLELTHHYRGPKQLIVEISCVIKNVGSSMVIVENVQLRAKYRKSRDPEETRGGVEPALAHVIKPVKAEYENPKYDPKRKLLTEDWFWVLRPRTFIQPSVTQRYRKPFAISAEAQVLHVWGAFDYRIQIGGAGTRALIGLVARPPRDLDWRKGIRAHTVRRTFSLSEPGAPQPSSNSPEASPPR